MGFQTSVPSQPAAGIAGDFASTNPHASVLAAPGALVAPAGGLTVGRFAFVTPGTFAVSQAYTSGAEIGFVGRNQQALITNYLVDNGSVIPSGFPIVLFDEGDFWMYFAAGATAGQTVYADENTGQAVSGSATDTVTASAGATGTLTLTSGSAVATVVTVSAGIVSVGDVVVGTGVPAGTTIVNQLTGTLGGAGTYTMSANASANETAEAFTTNSVVLNVTAVLTGRIGYPQPITGTGVTAGTTTTGQNPVFTGTASTVNGSTNITVLGVLSGTLYVGKQIVGTGIPSGTTISSQTSGTPGGAGVYVMSAAATLTSGPPIIVQTQDQQGYTGQYTLSVAQNFASTTVTVTNGNVATKWTVVQTVPPGQVAKCSSWY